MTYDSFDTWFGLVQRLTPVPVAPSDRWYDAYLASLDPQEAAQSVQPVNVRGYLHALWIAVKDFFD